jgi:hypothetical protein
MKYSCHQLRNITYWNNYYLYLLKNGLMARTFTLCKECWQAARWDVGCGMWDCGFEEA